MDYNRRMKVRLFKPVYDIVIRTIHFPGPNTGSLPRVSGSGEETEVESYVVGGIKQDVQITLSQTLNSEIERLHPYNKSLVRYKRWSDSLSPFRGLTHKGLHKYLEWWYERPIYLQPTD